MPKIQNDLKSMENSKKKRTPLGKVIYSSASQETQKSKKHRPSLSEELRAVLEKPYPSVSQPTVVEVKPSSKEPENTSEPKKSSSKMSVMKTLMGFFALALTVSAFEKMNGAEVVREWKGQAIETIQPIRVEMGKYIDQKIENTQNTVKQVACFSANVVAEGTGINQMIDFSKSMANKLNSVILEKQNESIQSSRSDSVVQSEIPKKVQKSDAEKTPRIDPNLKIEESITPPVQMASDKTEVLDSTTSRSEDGSRSHPVLPVNEMVHLSTENLKDLVWCAATELKGKLIEEDYQTLTSLHTMPLSEKEMAEIRKNVELDHQEADFDYELKIWNTLIDQRMREMKDPFAEDLRDDLQKMGLSKEMDQSLQDAVSLAGECKREEVAEKRFQDFSSLSTMGLSTEEEEQMRQTIGNDLKTKSVDYELKVLEEISEHREFEMQGFRKRPSDLRRLEANDSQKSIPLKDRLSNAISDQDSGKNKSDINLAVVRNIFQKKDR